MFGQMPPGGFAVPKMEAGLPQQQQQLFPDLYTWYRMWTMLQGTMPFYPPSFPFHPPPPYSAVAASATVKMEPKPEVILPPPITPPNTQPQLIDIEKLQMPSDMVVEPENVSLDTLAANIQVTLKHENLWKMFHNLTNEMIVTKPGRNIFPKLEFRVTGLEKNNRYLFGMNFKSEESFKFKFSARKWTSSSAADDFANHTVLHSWNSRFPFGHEWMAQDLCFSKLKLSNNPLNRTNDVISVKSMHKYLPVVLIYRFDGRKFQRIEKEIKIAEFIAVTAYQNPRITELKIGFNPFAKGFRNENKHRRLYPKLEPLDERRDSESRSQNPPPPPPPPFPFFNPFSPPWGSYPGSMPFPPYFPPLPGGMPPPPPAPPGCMPSPGMMPSFPTDPWSPRNMSFSMSAPSTEAFLVSGGAVPPPMGSMPPPPSSSSSSSRASPISLHTLECKPSFANGLPSSEMSYPVTT